MGGREIGLGSLHQYWTYGGLLAGRPDERMNSSIVERTLKTAREHPLLSAGAPVALIAPKIEHAPTGLKPGGIEVIRRRTGSNVGHLYYPRLPAATCIGYFLSGELKSRTEDFGSRLCIVWFQPKFALPIDQNVEREIQRVAWEELAEGYDL